MKPALLVIDLQKAWRGAKSAASMDSARGVINDALPAFRRNGLPIAWIQHVDEKDGCPEGSEDFGLIDGLEPAPGEPRIVKRYGNSFNKTDLGRILAEAGADTLVLAGYCAEWCVLSTYRGALDLDYMPLLLEGGTASGDEENHRFVRKICDVVPFALLMRMLSERPSGQDRA
jgi:nicotinamidase-related amidase